MSGTREDTESRPGFQLLPASLHFSSNADEDNFNERIK